MVAGEASGDRLAARLIEALRGFAPHARFEGMAGPEMIAAGCTPLAHVDELSVMGLAEVVRQYPRLRRLRARLLAHFLATRPDVFVGIDVPDFTLGIAARLKSAGIATAHLVCPQVWAWRPGRARRLSRAVDQLLALLPFEPAFFEPYGVPTTFVGHPLADELPAAPDRAAARAALGLEGPGPIVAVMPGSRTQELQRLADIFLDGAVRLQRARPDVRLVACAAREAQLPALRELPAARGAPDLRLFSGCASAVLTAADVAVVASGTVSLEALLCGTPMVVGYRLAPLSYLIISRMVSIPHIAMPNILAGRALVPELIQHDLDPESVCGALGAWLDDDGRRASFLGESRHIHAALRQGAAVNAARAVLRLAGR